MVAVERFTTLLGGIMKRSGPIQRKTPLRRVSKIWEPFHGTRKRYAKGCRCDDCSRRESEYRAAWRLATGRTKTSRVLGGPS